MTYLSVVLLFKITITLATIVLPFMVFPKEKLNKLTQVQAASVTLFRLYGVAVLAILVAYAGGIYQLSLGELPITVLLMGLVSNAGAVLVLIISKAVERSLFHTVFFSTIAVLLAVAVMNPQLALQKVF